MTFGPLVSCDWLESEIDAADLVLFDATLYLANEDKNGREEYLRQHIPGARFFNIDEFSEPDTLLPYTVPSQSRFSRLVGKEGVENHTRIVVYDQKGLFSAARVWWLFHYFGHERIAVLDGGLPKWIAGGRKVDTGEPSPVKISSFSVNVHTQKLKGLGDVLRVVEKGDKGLILDARAANRFDGSSAESRSGIASGHIPGSRNVPYTRLLNSDHTLLPARTIRHIFAEAGVGEGEEHSVITSCGSGITAAVLLLGLAVAGLPEGALYDGSWTEWGGRMDTPKTNSI